MATHFETEEDLEEFLSRPYPEVIEALANLEGDLIILGVSGKMGPTLAMLAKRAIAAGGSSKRVIGVARFSSPGVAEKLQSAGVETISCDLLQPGALDALPEAGNVIYMAGMKFGATGREAETWAINAYLPGLVAQRYKRSKIVVFSSGNVYPFVPVGSGGCREQTAPNPIGEYAQSVLARERVFEYFSRQNGTPMVLFRLNYAVELRYGVLLDIAVKVAHGEPVDLSMGYVNVIWQGDANALALRALTIAEAPPRVLNVTGPETLSVRSLALRFGELLGKEPIFEGQEQADALLSNAQEAHRLFGYPRVPVGLAMEWVAEWVKAGGATLGKPTKFQVRDGKF